MTSMQSASSNNTTYNVRPAAFFISGFSNIPHAKYYYVFLFFVYTVTVIGNSFIMCIISLAQRLHTAKYIAVLNFAISDLGGSSAVIPKLIDVFLFEHQLISYEACLTNIFFVYHFLTLQSLTLVALAYDRLIAICLPLRYHAIISKTAMSLIIGVMWIFSMIINALLVGLITRLSFCRSTVVNSYFCDHGPVYKLACNDSSINKIMAYFCFGLLNCTPLILIIISYFCIATALLKITHGAHRMKAMKTCTSHLMLVGIFYLPLLGNIVAVLLESIDPNARIINNLVTHTIPPMLNPIIYTLKTDEVMQSIKELYKRSKVNNTVQRHMEQSVKK